MTREILPVSLSDVQMVHGLSGTSKVYPASEVEPSTSSIMEVGVEMNYKRQIKGSVYSIDVMHSGNPSKPQRPSKC